MVKKMSSAVRWCHVAIDMTNALTLTLKHDYFSYQNLIFGKIDSLLRVR